MEHQELLLTDQTPAFFTSLIKILATKFKIKQFRTTTYHPQSNGSIERSHHVLTEYLKMFISHNHDWDIHISTAMFSYNTFVMKVRIFPLFLCFWSNIQAPLC